MRTTILSGGDLVLADRVMSPGTLVLEGTRIVDVRAGAWPATPGAAVVDLTGHTVLPGFVDVHVHGVEGFDTLGSENAIAEIARRLPRYGVTAFCPTSIACTPEALTKMFRGMRAARTGPIDGARVLSAHLESNFINPEYRGAQPLECIRRPPRSTTATSGPVVTSFTDAPEPGFSGEDILRTMDEFRDEVGIVTIAPELPDALGLISLLSRNGVRVSLGHSGATFDEAMAGVAAGARHATHLFNRMRPLGHREPGLSGAVLRSDKLAAELVCDGHHVHPAVMHTAIRAKHVSRMMAITDGTAGSGLSSGSRVMLGERTITVRSGAAYLDDGTLAGSVLTMDGAFRMLVQRLGLSFPEAATMCAATAARELGLDGVGRIATGSAADLTVLDRSLRVVRTWVDGRLAFGA